MTSSARTSTMSGIWRPSAFAVLRLSTVSYLVGACTGRLAGLVVQGENDAIVRVTVAGQPYAIDDRRN